MGAPEESTGSHWTVDEPTHRPFWLYLVTFGAAVAVIVSTVIAGMFGFALFLMSTHFGPG